jgi:hypothetical protein
MNFERQFSKYAKKASMKKTLKPSIKWKPKELMNNLINLQMHRNTMKNNPDDIWKRFYCNKYVQENEYMFSEVFDTAYYNYNLFNVENKKDKKYLSSWSLYAKNEKPTYHFDILLKEMHSGYLEGCYLIEEISYRSNNMELDSLKRLHKEMNSELPEIVDQYDIRPFNNITEEMNNIINNKLYDDNIKYDIKPYIKNNDDEDNFDIELF